MAKKHKESSSGTETGTSSGSSSTETSSGEKTSSGKTSKAKTSSGKTSSGKTSRGKNKSVKINSVKSSKEDKDSCCCGPCGYNPWAWYGCYMNYYYPYYCCNPCGGGYCNPCCSDGGKKGKK